MNPPDGKRDRARRHGVGRETLPHGPDPRESRTGSGGRGAPGGRGRGPYWKLEQTR
ncbi:hypothetical protein [Streptomyces collinus]|uniref:hypothetical protein n=1 Tax=Streptomyces collinus TaxID=42684 RepID=UPI0036AF3087